MSFKETGSGTDWDPLSKECQKDSLSVYDRLRKRCPVAFSEKLGWSVFRYQDVMRVLNDHVTYSNVVSKNQAVPNGFDPPRHTAYRRLIEPFFTTDGVSEFARQCRSIAHSVIAGIHDKEELEFVTEVAEPYSVHAQCAFMGWKREVGDSLLKWMKRSQEATLTGDRETLDAVAGEFRDLIFGLLDTPPTDGERDLLNTLQQEMIDGIPLSREEIVSIVRNWTVGELGTLSAALAIIAHGLATNGDVQARVRAQAELIPYAIEEFLRMDGPLRLNRRRVARSVRLAGRQLEVGERLTILWPSANRDSDVFENPDQFQWDRDLEKSLLYGHGIHVCPGAALARLELNVLVEALLQQFQWIAPASAEPPEKAPFPAAGFRSLRLKLNRVR